MDNESGKDCVTCDCVVLPIAKFICDEILKQFDGLHKPEYCAFDAIGERKFTFEGEHPEHMTGYDMVLYWEEVKHELEKI
jgi:predicted Zn-dependent protease with MMP-like domain